MSSTFRRRERFVRPRLRRSPHVQEVRLVHLDFRLLFFADDHRHEDARSLKEGQEIQRNNEQQDERQRQDEKNGHEEIDSRANERGGAISHRYWKTIHDLPTLKTAVAIA